MGSIFIEKEQTSERKNLSTTEGGNIVIRLIFIALCLVKRSVVYILFNLRRRGRRRRRWGRDFLGLLGNRSGIGEELGAVGEVGEVALSVEARFLHFEPYIRYFFFLKRFLALDGVHALSELSEAGVQEGDFLHKIAQEFTVISGTGEVGLSPRLAEALNTKINKLKYKEIY